MQQTKDINAATLEFDRLRRLATLRHYETMARVAEAQWDAQLATTAAHYMAQAAEAQDAADNQKLMFRKLDRMSRPESRVPSMMEAVQRNTSLPVTPAAQDDAIARIEQVLRELEHYADNVFGRAPQ